MEHTAVHENRAEFGLTGMGNRWSHDTMTSTEATQIKLDMFRNIQNGISIDPDTSLWYLAYLYDQGFGFNEMADMQIKINAMIADQLDGCFSDTTQAEILNAPKTAIQLG